MIGEMTSQGVSKGELREFEYLLPKIFND